MNEGEEEAESQEREKKEEVGRKEGEKRGMESQQTLRTSEGKTP